ncbi:MAG: hypothetical protein JW786_08950 [Desulfobacterales bacterium]|nr:hypothetical protein [Desulfobacterales bacterium]
MKLSKVDNIVTRIKNNPVLSILITIGIAVIALATFTDAIENLLKTVHKIVGTPSPVDITGKWRTAENEETSATYFDFKVVDNNLYGTVWVSPSFSMQHSESGILEGRIIGKRVSFTTKNKYIKEFGVYNFETKQKAPDIIAELVVYYDGEIRGDEIHFRRQTGSGYYKEFIAKKIVDLTEITTARKSPGKKDVYSFVYALPGHTGGVRSLSFGPDQGRFRSGGLRLASAGVRDGKIKFWDIATAEACGEKELMSNLAMETSVSSAISNEHISTSTDSSKLNPNEQPIYVAYRPKTREGGIDLITVGVSLDRRVLKFFSWYFWPGGGSSGGGSTQEVLGTIGLLSICGDSYKIATAETEGDENFNINIRSSNGTKQHTLHCEDIITALAFSENGKLLVSAEGMESKETTIKMWDTDTGGIIRRISSQRPVSHLSISADGSLLASGSDNDGQISIWDTNNGTVKFALSSEPDKGVTVLLFSNTGKFLASAGVSSDTIKLWNVYTGMLDHEIKNEEPVGALSFSFDDRLLATGGSAKGNIRVWARPMK